ncbi:MAG: hypothetical protein INR72_10685 [Williamsia herbipolensis]|nr:hypothetical protein [Williamsia herbipolensis]
MPGTVEDTPERVCERRSAVLSIAFTIMFAILLVVLILQWQRGRAGGRAAGGGLFGGGTTGFVEGTLTVTGVSDQAEQGDKNGDMFCTVSGTIIGPDTPPTDVYGHLVLGADTPWPKIGTDMPVVYKPGKAETSWRFGSLEVPPAA